jgi:exodeoxyribonuclease III
VKLVCWNVNSIRARHERLVALLARHTPDVVCLQETKVADAQFPHEELHELGYQTASFGQRAYNGVAILVRGDVSDVRCGLEDEVEDPQARLISARAFGVRIVCCYVPNGGELTSDKYAYKLAWLKRLRSYLERTSHPDEPLVVCGDFNVAPRACDVAYPEQWESSVLFHPSAREALDNVAAWGLIDLLAEKVPQGGVYSWWDYRMLAFPRGDGLRIDLILATPPVARACHTTGVDRDERKGKQPSDHAPVIAEFSPLA